MIVKLQKKEKEIEDALEDVKKDVKKLKDPFL